MGSLVPRLHREKKSLNLPCPTWPEYKAKLWGTAPIFHSVCDDSVYPVCHVSLSLFRLWNSSDLWRAGNVPGKWFHLRYRREMVATVVLEGFEVACTRLVSNSNPPLRLEEGSGYKTSTQLGSGVTHTST